MISLPLLAPRMVAGCLHKLTRMPKGMLWFLKSILAPRRHDKKWYLLIGWYPGSVYIFHIHLLCFLCSAMERNLTGTNTLFYLCVMSHGTVNYLFFSWVRKFKGNTSQGRCRFFPSSSVPFFMFACAQRISNHGTVEYIIYFKSKVIKTRIISLNSINFYHFRSFSNLTMCWQSTLRVLSTGCILEFII